MAKMYPVIVKIVSVVLLIALSTTLLAGAAPPLPADVESGQIVSIEDFPFVAIIKKPHFYPRDLGAIVNERFIVTTSWTAYWISIHIDESSVSVGATIVKNDAEIYTIEKAIAHKNDSAGPYILDHKIGLLKLAKSLTFGPRVAAATFAPKGLVIKTGTVVNITRVQPINMMDYHELRLYTGSYLNTGVCRRSYDGTPWIITQRQFCVLEESDDNQYTVGFGSPVVLNGTVLGFSIFSSENEPDIYLKISPYLKWMEHQIRKNS